MKNISSIEYPDNHITKCYKNCGLKSFICETIEPNNLNKITCSLCHKANTLDNKTNMFYCDKCTVLYSLGCIHSVNGGNDNLYNGHLISKWKMKATGDIYYGMPSFATQEELNEKFDGIEIMQMVCPNGGTVCANAFYSKEKYPHVYIKCDLPNKNLK